MRALRHRVGHHAVDPDGRKRDSEPREHRQQHHAETPRGHGIRHQRPHGPDIEHCQVLVHGVNLVAQGGGHRRRINRRAHYDVEVSKRRLSKRKVGLHPRTPVEPVVLHVPHHAHHLPHAVHHENAFADGILTGPVFFDHGFVHNHHRLAARLVAIVEEPPAPKRNPHRPKVISGDESGFGKLLVDSPSGSRTPFDAVPGLPVLISQRQIADGAHGRHAACAAGGLQQPGIESRHFPLIGICGRGERHPHSDHALGAESGIDVRHLDEALDQQRRTHRQHK